MLCLPVFTLQNLFLVYKCEFCDKEFRRLSNMRSHSEVHKSIEFRNVIMCHFPHCSRFYSKKSNLVQHIKSYHDKQPFVCSQENCHKSFKTKVSHKKLIFLLAAM